ncbi:hypothetical protein V757_02760 [Pelistega indica]|uniref:Uncharacterized protein n=1 Tax=Pelistega indica TaxID=1414851 RepID=V8G824_9BURK|nr:hypothetical protein V757_02760 [Pelistega indica]
MPTVQADENFPTKSITIIVPAAPGGTADIAARLLSEPFVPIPFLVQL